MLDITNWFLKQDIDFEKLETYCENKISLPTGFPRTLGERDTNIPTEDEPVASNGLFMAHNTFQEVKNSSVASLLSLFTDYFNTSEMSGCLYYPRSGYMGWHTNSNHPGHRIYVSYSNRANSNTFSYVKDGRVVQSFDKPGFTVRHFEVYSDELFWHRVDAKTPRFSLGFKTPNS